MESCSSGKSNMEWKIPLSDIDLGEEEIAEELVDVIFYVLDASRLACPSVNMDEIFKKKLERNKSREYQYGERHRLKGS